MRIIHATGTRIVVAASIFVSTIVVLLSAFPSGQVGAATPTFVQARANEIRTGTINNLAFSSANTSGNLIIAYAVWNNGGTAAVTDSRGNTYTSVSAPTRWNNNSWSAQVFYAKNIAGGANTVTATYGTAVNSFGILYIHEYSGMDKVNPLDVTRSAVGTANAMSSGTVATTNAADLIVGAGASINRVNQAGSGFTARSTAYGNMTEDRNVTALGSYAATATQNGSSWVLQMVAFKAAPSDTTPPTIPAGLTATAVSTSQINLSWTASTDAVGVTGYKIFRGGTQIATTASTSYQNTGLTQSTSYSYSVAAYDAANNTSAQSSVASATTLAPAPDTTPPSVPSGLQSSNVTAGSAMISWTASTDNTAVTGYKVYRDGTQVTSTATTSYTDTGLGSAQTYSYTVAAFDAANNTSSQSTALPVTTSATGPITVPLRRTGQNSHYFIDGNGKAVVLTGSHTWNDFQDWGNGTIQPIDFNAYVNMLTSNNQNFTFMWATEMAHFCNLPTGGVLDYDVSHMPWQRTGPGLADDGKPKFDLTKFDQVYFDRLRSRVQQLNSAGIYAAVYAFTGEWLNLYRCNDGYPLTGVNNINGINDGGGVGAINMNAPNAITALQDALVEKLVDSLNDLPNVMWATSEEAPTNSTWWNNHHIDHFHAYEATKPFQHPVGYGNFINTSDADMFSTNADWVAPGGRISSINNCGTGTPTCKVVINDSDHSYFGIWNDSDLAVRNYIWDNFTNGNQVAFMDPWLIYYPREGRNNCVNPVNGVCSAPDSRYDGLRANLGYTRTYADRTNFVAMSPSDSLASTGNVLANTSATATEFLVYTDAGGSFTVNLSQTTRSLKVEWLNPATGAKTFGSNITGGSANRSFTPPFSGDALLYVYDAALGTTDVQAPTVPTNLAAAAASATQINLSWNASTDNAAVAGYKVYRNGSLVGSPGTTLYQDAGLVGNTSYSYTVAAFDAAGNTSAQTAPVSATTLTSPPDTSPPTVTLSSPSAGTILQGAASLSASASDDVGVLGVQFLLNGVNLGVEDSFSPYSLSWDTTTVANGTYVLAARARDGASNLTTSTPVTVTVNNSATPPGLVAGYAFDEGSGTTTADSSGHGLSGTLMNGSTWTTGRFGNAVNVDGANDNVSLGNPASLQLTGSMTISGWVYSSAFPGDDAAIVSKRGSNGYQLDTTIDTGPRTVGFKLTSSTGGNMFRYGATTLQLNTWNYVSAVYDATARTMDVYLNGQLDNGALVGTVTATQQNSTNSVLVGQRAGGGFNFTGKLDNIRLYGRALSASEIQTTMNAPLGSSGSADSTPPTASITAPANGAQVADIMSVTANAADDVGVVGVQFYVDGAASGPEDLTSPYALTWDTRTATNGSHALTARSRDAAGNSTLSAGVTVNVANANFFQNEILATGFNLPTAMKFLPDGRLLIAELAGRIGIVPAPYTTPAPSPFLQITNIGSAGVQQGIYDFALDPGFATNHFYYVFYTLGSPNVDRLSRFTANSGNTATVAGSEFVLYQDPQVANAEHHGGAIMFGNDGKLYFTTGEHFNAPDAQSLTNPRGKLHRINLDGSVPTDNPFYDGAGPNWDSIWAYGLRNPYRAYYDAPTGRMFIGDVGGNDYSTAREEVNIGARGANYGWPNSEGPCSAPCTSPLYYYAHNGRDASITGGFVYHGTAFPGGFDGSYLFGDYTQNWIRRLTLDGSGSLTGTINVEPADGSVDGPYGDIVYLVQGPDGAIYYLDLGYSDISGSFGISKLRRIKYVQSNQAPIVAAAASVTNGPLPLTVDFSSSGSSDPEGTALTYLWDFGDNVTSTQANPTHIYTQAGTFTARLTVSDSVNNATSTPLTISAGNKPVASILSPTDGAFFVAGNVISYSGDATDTEDGTLPASAYTWNIDFLHEGHVHPGTPVIGSKSGTFTIPTSGHDFSGNTRYRITLTVVDSNGLSDTKSVIVWPTKVNLSFATAPTGLTLYLDGIAKTSPFVYDTLVGFNHTIEARNQSANGNNYTFASWSDGGAQLHTIVVPAASSSYSATFTSVPNPAGPIAFVQVSAATPQTSQTVVSTSYTQLQRAGDFNVAVVGWNNTTSTISSVTDTLGNTYVLAAPTTRGVGISQAIYYAKNVAAGSNTVTVTFNQSTAAVDVRVLEYSGIDPVSPFDKTASASGTASSANSGSVTTTAAKELIFGAGTTTGSFSAPGTGFTTRIITTPDADIAEDRTVTATGSYSATATQSGNWVMQVVTFKGAAQ